MDMDEWRWTMIRRRLKLTSQSRGGEGGATPVVGCHDYPSALPCSCAEGATVALRAERVRLCLLPESDAVLPQRLPMVLSQVPLLPPLVVAVFGAGACSQGLCTGAEWCWAAGSSVERRAVVSLLALCTRACCCVHAQRAFTSDKQRTCVSG